eukprot:1159566-Pelagomonas_calceolata.AAC.21
MVALPPLPLNATPNTTARMAALNAPKARLSCGILCLHALNAPRALLSCGSIGCSKSTPHQQERQNMMREEEGKAHLTSSLPVLKTPRAGVR